MVWSDGAYTGAIPEIYDRNLGQLLFAPYADDIGQRAKQVHPRRILEIASGTGIVTEALARALPTALIEATDLNQAMVDYASSRRTNESIRWSTADAQSLPFADDSFDLVVCQFGAMFFPDRVTAFREARRVLTAEGSYLVSLWDGLAANDIARICAEAARSVFPQDPPLFLERAPYGHANPVAIEKDLREAGFSNVVYDRVEKRSRGPILAAARGLVEGTPLRFEIQTRDTKKMADVVDTAMRALEKISAGGQVDGAMAAFVFTAS